MQTLVVLLVVAVAACAIARPPGPTAVSALHGLGLPSPLEPRPPPQDYLSDYLLPRLLLPLDYLAGRRLPAATPDNWLNREIYRINQMDEDDDRLTPYEMDLGPWIQVPAQDLLRGYDGSSNVDMQIDYPPDQENFNSEEDPEAFKESARIRPKTVIKITPQEHGKELKWRNVKFALTPVDKGYYERDETSVNVAGDPRSIHQEGGALAEAMALEPPRQIRQNPNLSKQKHLLGPDLGKLKSGLANKEYRLPVSLLPTNLRWLKTNRFVEESSDSSDAATDLPRHIHMMESAADPGESIYGVAIFAAIGAALTIAIFGFAFGWYTLSKKAKAAADVDYPAYGVTGPTIDTSGDRKLAQSAHMYHQKQQIIAMERNGMEQRAGSVSDPESEEENEEGDYTVYECPGFATTGDMEVKNPMFSEEPTPATPGRCELVRPQPKD